MEKLVKCRVNKQSLEFLATTEAYSQYMRELTINNKIAPARNFLMRTVKPESKEALKELLELPGVDVQLCNHVLEEFLPEVEIELGE